LVRLAPSLPLFNGGCRCRTFRHQPGPPRGRHDPTRRSPSFHGFQSLCISTSFHSDPNLHDFQTRSHYPETGYHDISPTLPILFFGATTIVAAATSSSVERLFLSPQPVPSSASPSRASFSVHTTLPRSSSALSLGMGQPKLATDRCHNTDSPSYADRDSMLSVFYFILL